MEQRHLKQPGGLEFEVMDRLYRLPFRDWLELNSRGASTQTMAAVETEETVATADAVKRKPSWRRLAFACVFLISFRSSRCAI